MSDTWKQRDADGNLDYDALNEEAWRLEDEGAFDSIHDLLIGQICDEEKIARLEAERNTLAARERALFDAALEYRDAVNAFAADLDEILPEHIDPPDDGGRLRRAAVALRDAMVGNVHKEAQP